jgi:hypothetical protein
VPYHLVERRSRDLIEFIPVFERRRSAREPLPRAVDAAFVRHEGELVGHRVVVADREAEVQPVEAPAAGERDLREDRKRPQRKRGV